MALHTAAPITNFHWQALDILSKAIGEHLTGLSHGARKLKLGSIRHVTQAGNEAFIHQLHSA
eukprot:12905962-Prorocentrum_lima.AAC.1